MTRRGLCMLLALVMLFSMAIPAFAEEEPVEVTEEPVEVTEEPVEEAEEPVEEAEEPAEEAEEPAEEAEEPVEEAEEPVEEAEEPVEEAEEPVEEAEEPVEEAEEPAEEAEEPAEEIAPVALEDEIMTVAAEKSGNCGANGNNLTWKLDGDTLTISGTGDMQDYDQFGGTVPPWYEYRESITTIYILGSVTSVGSAAFYSAGNLQTVAIPSSVTEIGAGAFSNCSALTELTLNEGLKRIDDSAFSGCVNIETIDLPTTLTAIGDNAFYHCSGATGTVSVPKGVKNIGANAFSGCGSLSRVVLAKGVETLGSNAFSHCGGLASVSLPKELTSIGDYAFYECDGLSTVTIPSTLETLGEGAFSGCTALESVDIPNSVTTLGEAAFAGCTGLASAVVGSGVTILQTDAFSGCSSLTSIILGAGLTGIYSNSLKGTAIKSVTIPASVRIIENNAFDGDSALKTVVFEGGAPGIYPNAFSGVTATAYYPKGDSSWTESTRVDYGGDLTWTNSAPPAGTALATPKLTKAENVSTGVKITWEAVSGAAKYRVFYKSGSTWKKIADTTATSYTWTGALMETTYTFTVRCVSADGKSYTSAYDKTGLSVTTPFKVLDAPKLTGVSNTYDGVKITWEPVPGAVKYRVFYKTGSKSWSRIANTTATSYTWADAKAGTRYTFTVRCLSADGSMYVSSYDKTGKSITAAASLAAPSLSSVSNTSSGVRISWKAVSGAAQYRVFYKTSGTSWTKIADTTATSYTWAGAESGTVYTFTVRCLSADGKSYTSAYDKEGLTNILATPKLTGVSTSSDGVRISWRAVSGAAKYRVFYKTGGKGWTKIADTTATSYTWNGAKTSTVYTFTVRCVSADGKSYTSAYDKTGVTNAKTLATPKLISATNTSNGVRISWKAVSGASKYRVFYKTGSKGWTRIANTTATSYTWTGANTDLVYTFTVRCVSSDGGSYVSAYDKTGVTNARTLATPQLVSVASTAAGAKITWKAVSGAAKYRVFYKTGSGSWTRIANTTATSYTWDGAKSGTTYTFTVRCISADGGSYTSAYDKSGKSLTYVR